MGALWGPSGMGLKGVGNLLGDKGGGITPVEEGLGKEVIKLAVDMLPRKVKEKGDIADCKFSNLVYSYQLQCTNFNTFYIGETNQMLF